ncbi:hypothetical protein MNV49_007079 [Pseudohyphozyma bogoriensis]|nr:hypothetical protein MNV49_007079 [Pseudohyphozyma bogoriensis]
MAQKKSLPFGSWPTPITSSLVLSSAVSLQDVVLSPSKNELYWVEGRPGEGGRNAIVSNGEQSEVIKSTKFNARTRVHEYGGASTTVVGEGRVVFASVEGPLYEVTKGERGWSEPKQVSPDSKVLRYADFSAHPTTPNLLLTVVEDHTTDVPSAVVNTLSLLSLSPTPTLHPFASGADFYSAPRFSPSGNKVAWLQWDHPSMPWESAELWVADVGVTGEGEVDVKNPVKVARKVAGEKGGKESCSQPRWSEQEGEEELVFLSDRTGFYELYTWSDGKGVEAFLPEPTGADAGSPDWTFGASTHAPLFSSHWISRAKSGSLRITSLSTRTCTTLKTPYVSISTLRVISPTKVAVIASSKKKPDLLAILTLPEGYEGEVMEEVVKVSSAAKVDEDYISVGKEIKYPVEGGEAYGIWYEPTSKKFVGEKDELPPLVVHCHGGPTSAASAGLAWATQYFTSRGFAYVDVNYGGSTGYGKAYRERLNSSWGVTDVSDTIAAVEYLVKEGKVDPKRVAITGGSAGGFTVLAALTKSKVFTAGTSLYGISDLNLLAGDTHKFESQYLFGLLGGTPTEVPEVYHDRSPINHSSSITAPLLILQGTLDEVVPPAQATKMAEEVRGKGVKCELVMFEGEGHGFRKAESKKRAFEGEVGWYRDTWGIGGGEKVEM